ncbi:hypothetical protein SAMN06265222_12823 [Neorhodopirellula lusitana]|uniref:Alpha-galactosidase n=1 Tax=Neorhodopirellula lusitana TaxID=445327 RepID=A0ABY1QS31_9BACT|nr:hypothetical protein [Neorhodopirellula lusitana]SMP78868.1 hypothetical protein SAMN06265222_12823 [Neorhodopirellula lusitana]
MRIHLALFALTVLASIGAADTVVENKDLRVIVSQDDHSISIQRTGDEFAFVPNAVFSQEVERVTTSTALTKDKETSHLIHLDHVGGWQTQLAIHPNSPFVHISRTVRNETDQPIEANSLDFLNYQVDVGVEPSKLQVLGTGGLTPVAASQGSYAFSAIADPDTRHGVVSGWMTHERGVGVFFPENHAGGVQVKAQIDFGHYQVDPGKSRPTETLLIGYFDDARLGLEAYASSIAKHYDIQLAASPGVYCTWYHAGASDENQILENTEFVVKELKPFGLGVMQIDDKWQSILPKDFKHDGEIQTTGPIKVFVDTADNYSKGMAHTAKEITDRGMVPGIWFMPFAGNFRNPYFDPEIFAKNPDGTPFHDARWSGTCIDSTNPKAEKFIRERVRRIYDWGYRYFKIDGMHTGAISYNTYINKAYGNQDFGKSILHDPHMTHIQAYRKCLGILHEEAPNTFILGCNVSQNMRSMGPAFGMVDGMRIGPDNGSAARGLWDQVVLGAWHGTNLYFLNGKVWHNDPDPVYPRADNPLSRARWMCSWMAVAGNMHTSSEQYSTLPEDRLDILRRCLPSHQLQARPVDLFETNQPRIWMVQNDRMNVVGLFNWNEDSADEIVDDLDKLGLDSDKTYIGFDFWANEFIGPIAGELRRTLAPASCQVLAIAEIADHPQLISTSRHITQGLIDVLEEKWDAGHKTLTGNSAVVGDDPYELRLALPADGTWKISNVSTDDADATIRILSENQTSARLVIETPNSREIRWSVSFQ